MYVPGHFREQDPERLAAFLKQNSFGVLITVRGGEPFVSHLPFLFATDEGPHGVLYSHVARANPHWKAGDGRALALFSGPHHYVSPSWYAEEGTVPTWSYVAVHARGVLEWLDEDAARRDVLERMVEFFEAGAAQPWEADFGAAYIQREMRAIVPFRVQVESLEGKWKLSQHHPRARQERTARALRALESDDAQAIAALMEENLARGAEDRPR